MSGYLKITISIFFLWLKASQAQDSNPGSNNRTNLEKVCEPMVDAIHSPISGCIGYFGDAVIFTDLGNQIIKRDNTKENVCDYYTPETVVNDCLYPNGTNTAFICSFIFSLAYELQKTCIDYYSIDDCKLTTLGQLQLSYSKNPCVNCRPAPGPNYCQLNPNTGAMPCSNCANNSSGSGVCS